MYIKASEQDRFDAMVVLLENSADPNLKNISGETAIEAALLKGEFDKVDSIKKYLDNIKYATFS